MIRIGPTLDEAHDRPEVAPCGCGVDGRPPGRRRAWAVASALMGAHRVLVAHVRSSVLEVGVAQDWRHRRAHRPCVPLPAWRAGFLTTRPEATEAWSANPRASSRERADPQFAWEPPRGVDSRTYALRKPAKAPTRASTCDFALNPSLPDINITFSRHKFAPRLMSRRRGVTAALNAPFMP